MGEASRKRCFFDISINNLDSGKIIFELFNDITPKTCENFRQLCTGEHGIGEVHGKQLYYKGIIFHRVIKGFMVQSGDFINSNGTGGESIYGKTFDDENFTIKHDKPFLLSMANRGKNTNSSQFFITTAPATHLDGIHTVFGRVVSGIEVVKMIEDLPVDRNSRPMDEAMVKACGELVKQSKAKKEKKKKKVESSATESDSSEASSQSSEDEKRKKKKKKKDKKKSKKAAKKKEPESSVEEGELESDTEELNPMVSITKIDPSEIPEVTNRFLMRDQESRDGKNSDRNGAERGGEQRERNFGWSKRSVPHSRSGRIIKGRGNFRYRTPSRSRSRSFTPEHWRQASRKLIKMTDFEKIEERKKSRDDEIKRRIEERKKRHEAVARGDGKKPFYELQHEVANVAIEERQPISEKSIDDPNALDYEVDEEELQPKKTSSSLESDKKIEKSRKRSRSRDIDRRRDDQDRKPSRRNFDTFRNRFDDDYRRSRDRGRDRRRSRSRSWNRNTRRHSSRDNKNSRKRHDSRSSSSAKSQKVPTGGGAGAKQRDEIATSDAEKLLQLIVKEKDKVSRKRRTSSSAS